MKKRYLITIMAVVMVTMVSACGSPAVQNGVTGSGETVVIPQNQEAPATQNTTTQETVIDTAISETEAPEAIVPEVAAKPNNQAKGSQVTTGSITEAKAKEIALNHAQIAEADATFINVKLDMDDGQQEYEVEFYVQNKEYDYAINATDGTIISFDYDVENYTPTVSTAPVGTQAATKAGVTIEDAKKTALAKVSGAKETDIRIQQDMDDGRITYEGKIIYNNMEYDFEIDATTGNVTEWEEESIFD